MADRIVMDVQIQLRRDTRENWNTYNPILLKNEIGFESDTGRYKFGDGINRWGALDYSHLPAAVIDETELLRFVTDEQKANWNDAYDKRHVHDNKEILDGMTASYTTEEKAKLAGVAAGAEVNVQADWNVTEELSDAYIRNKPTKMTADGGNSDTVDNRHVDDTKDTDEYLWTAAKTKAYADGLLSANDAMVFKGTLGVGGTAEALPTSGYSAGWTYRIITDGVYATHKCEAGDMIVAIHDYTTADATVTDWTVIQTNIDGAVTGSSTNVVDGHIPVYDGVTGRIIKTSGKTLPAGDVVGNTDYGTEDVAGVVKSSAVNNQVSIGTDGVMRLNPIDTAQLVDGGKILMMDDVLVLNGGHA